MRHGTRRSAVLALVLLMAGLAGCLGTDDGRMGTSEPAEPADKDADDPTNRTQPASANATTDARSTQLRVSQGERTVSMQGARCYDAPTTRASYGSSVALPANVSGSVLWLNVTATWEATSPLQQELEVEVFHDDFESTGAAKQGTSPIDATFDLSGNDIEQEIQLALWCRTNLVSVHLTTEVDVAWTLVERAPVDG